MAFVLKKMYKTLLKRVLGKYLKDELDVDQFDVNLLAGSLVLNTLDLNVEEMNSILQNMKTPFRFTSCMVDHFELKIPSLDGLLSEGCNVTVAGVEANLVLCENETDTGTHFNYSSERNKDKQEINNNNNKDYGGDNLASTGEGLADLTSLIERIASKINLTITDVHIEVNIPKMCHSLIIKIPGLYSYDEDAAQFKANAKMSQERDSYDSNNIVGRKTPPRRSIRFESLSIYIAERYNESYNGIRGMLGIGTVSATTYKILTCGNNHSYNNNGSNSNNGVRKTNYFTMTMTEDVVDNDQHDNDQHENDGVNSSTTTIKGFFKTLSLTIPSKHCYNVLLESIDSISAALNDNSSNTYDESDNRKHHIDNDTNKNKIEILGNVKFTQHSVSLDISILQTNIDFYHTVYSQKTSIPSNTMNALPVLKCLSITSVNTTLEVMSKTRATVCMKKNVAHVKSSTSSATSKFMINSPKIIEYVVNNKNNKEKPMSIWSYRDHTDESKDVTSVDHDKDSLVLNYSIDEKGTSSMKLLSEGSTVNITIDLITLNTWLYYVTSPAATSYLTESCGNNLGNDKVKFTASSNNETPIFETPVGSSSTLIHIPKGCIKLLVCKHGNKKNKECISDDWVQREWLDPFLLINVVDLKVALGDQMDHGLLIKNCKRFLKHRMIKHNKSGDCSPLSSLPNLDTMITFHSFTVDKFLQSEIMTHLHDSNLKNKSMIEACGGKIKVNGTDLNDTNEVKEKFVLPTVCIHPLKLINSLKKIYGQKNVDGCNDYYHMISNGNEQLYYKTLIHENVNVKSSQYRSYEPESSPKMRTGQRKNSGTNKSSYDVDKKKTLLLIKENKYVNDALSCVEVCLPICQLYLSEDDYALLTLLVEDILKDNSYKVAPPTSITIPTSNAESSLKKTGISCMDDRHGHNGMVDKSESNQIESALCLQVLRCEVYIKEIDLPITMVDEKHNISSTWKINGELGDGLSTYPASSGIPETDFIKRCIEHLKQRLYHNQNMEYHVTLADFQLLQIDGIHDDEKNVSSYMRIGAADLTLREEPYGIHINDGIDPGLSERYYNLSNKPVMYGTKWGLNTNKYATHVPFGSLNYGSILFMTIDTTLSVDSGNNQLQDVVVDGDIYGVTFRYSVPSSWLFRVIDIVLNPRKSKNIVYNGMPKTESNETINTTQIDESIDIFTNVNVRFHETIVDYIPTQVNTRSILLINSINVSSNIVTSSNETKFQIGVEDLSIMLRNQYLPYHADESKCRILVYNPSIKGNDNYENMTVHNIYANDVQKKSEKLTVWDVQHLLSDVGYVKVLDLDTLNVILTLRQSNESFQELKKHSNIDNAMNETTPLSPSSNVSITIGVLQLFTCYDSCNKLIETISKWWEEFGASDMFLGKWIKKARNPSAVRHSDTNGTGTGSTNESKQVTLAKSHDLRKEGVTKQSSPNSIDNSKHPSLSLLSHINNESAFGGNTTTLKSTGHVMESGTNMLKTAKPVGSEHTLNSNQANKKLVIVDDYYDMNNYKMSSSMPQRNNDLQNSDIIGDNSSLESSFEFIDMDEFTPNNGHNVVKTGNSVGKKYGINTNPIIRSNKITNSNVVSKANVMKRNGDENYEEWGDDDSGANGSKSLMISWFGGHNDHDEATTSTKDIPLSTILQSPTNKVKVKESTGMLNITFNDNTTIPNDILQNTSVGDEEASIERKASYNLSKDTENLTDSGYSESNSDFNSNDSSVSDESDSELWESAYGNTMNINNEAIIFNENREEGEKGKKLVINYVDEEEQQDSVRNAQNDEAPYNMANSIENLKHLPIYDTSSNDNKKIDKNEATSESTNVPNDIYEDEGLQHVRWYKGSAGNASESNNAVDILPHYIPIVPLSSCGGGAIGSINSIPDLPQSIKITEGKCNYKPSENNNTGKTYVVSRVVINKMNLSWKWFDGKDWDIQEDIGTGSFRRHDKDRMNLFASEEKTSYGQRRDINQSINSSKETLLGIILGDKDEEEGNNNTKVENNANLVQWWVTADYRRELNGIGTKKNDNSIHYIPCGRIVETMVEIRLTDFAMRSDTYNETSPYSSNLIVHIHNFELVDHLLTSNLKKIISHWRSNKLHPRETNKPMVRLSMLNVKTGEWRDQSPSYIPDDEIRMKLGLLPLRINLDQDAAYFIANFITNLGENEEFEPYNEKNDNVVDRHLDKKEHFPSSPEKLEPDMYFQTVTIGSVKVKIDYHPKRVDIKGLREGNYFELINILPMEGLTLLLPKVELLSLKGIDIVGSKIGNIWGKEIIEKQLHHLAAGINVPPIRSLANVCNGACDIVLLPLKQYRKGGHISSSLRTSTSNFVHTLSLEALTNASRLAATTQTILESAHDYLASSSKVNKKNGYFDMVTKKSKFNRKRNSSRKTYDKHHKNLTSVYSDQPANVTEALNQAAKRLSTRFNSSQRTVVAVPIGQYKEKGIGGTVHNVVKAMPVAILGPMIGGAEALSRVILGARNSLDPDLTFDQNEKYKSTKDLSMQTRRKKKK